MKKIGLLFVAFLFSACGYPHYEQNYQVEHYLEASTDDSAAKWRQVHNIGRDALVAIYPDGKFEIVEALTRTRHFRPSMNTYVNEFVPCYLNMRGIYRASPVILQAPCERNPERWHHFGFYQD